MPLRAVAVYGCEVPPGDEIIPAIPDLGSHVVFPGFRITMAAIDPNEEPDSEELEKFPRPRSTLTIIRTTAEDETDIFEEMKLRKKYPELFPELGDDSESDSTSGSDSDEEVNGGPSDPAKSKKARKEAAVKDLIESLKAEDSDEEMEEANGTNGVVTSKKKGKAKATEEDSEDGDSDDTDDSDDGDYQEYVVCTLDPENHCQQALDISVGNNEVVYFRVSGTHTVFITGNYQVTDEVADEQDRRKELFHDSLNDYSSDDDSEDSELDLSPDEDELTLDMDDESDELDDLEDPRITEVDSDDEEPPKLIKAPAEKEKKGKNKRTADELDEGASLDDIISKSLKTDAAEEPKLSKKQLKKLKKNNGEAATAKQDEKKNGDAKDVTPAKSDKSDKKVQFAKNLEQGPTGSAEKPKSAEKEKTKLGPKKVNGVTIDDKKIGSGPAAKKGDRVGMRYIGKLQDGKVFDSNKSGKPFSFKLGAGEVIKGWDIGVAGMSVGGERRLTIPANLAYGSKSNPGIPANSTLVFDVKLLEIK